MSIESNPIGGVKLSGPDAAAFIKQIEQPAPQAAIDSAKRGAKLLEEFNRTGAVRIKNWRHVMGGHLSSSVAFRLFIDGNYGASELESLVTLLRAQIDVLRES